MKKFFSLVLATAMATTMAFAAYEDVACGATVRLTATPAEGYNFVEWQAENGTTVSTANPLEIVASAAATYTAIFALKTYTITYEKGEYGTGNPATDTKTHGVALTLPGAVFTRTGHTQTGWSETSLGTNKAYELGASYTANAAITLYPYWTADTYTITYDKGAFGTGTVGATYKTYGIDAVLSGDRFTREGYTQDGWSTTDGGGVAYALGGTYTTNDNITLYPHWLINHYTITYDKGTYGSGTIDPTDKTFGINTTLSDQTFTREGYHQTGWATTDGGALVFNLGATYTDNGDITLYPVWEINKYQIRFLNWDGTELVAPMMIDHGQTPTYTGSEATKPEDPQYTYTFDSWSPNVYPADKDQDYVAQFASHLRSYTVSFVNYDGTPIQSTSVDYGTIPAKPTSDPVHAVETGHTWTFTGWTTDGIDFYDKAADLPQVQGDVTYTAVYSDQLNSYTITLVVGDPVAGGSVTGGGTYQYGTPITIKAIAADCYEFVEWNDHDTNAERSVTVAADATYTATFRKITYRITGIADDDSHGSVTIQVVPSNP